MVASFILGVSVRISAADDALLHVVKVDRAGHERNPVVFAGGDHSGMLFEVRELVRGPPLIVVARPHGDGREEKDRDDDE